MNDNSKSLPPFEAVIFDMDGVLFDSERIYSKAWIEGAARCGYRVEEAFYDDHLRGISSHGGEMRLVQEFGANFPLERFRAETLSVFNSLIEKDSIPLTKGAMELLELLQRRNIPKAIGTSACREEMLRHFAVHDLTTFFPVIVTLDDTGRAKPAPDIFLEAGRRLEVSPHSALVLEDSPNGILAAHRAGMMPVLIGGVKSASEEISALAVGTFSDLAEFTDTMNASLSNRGNTSA